MSPDTLGAALLITLGLLACSIGLNIYFVNECNKSIRECNEVTLKADKNWELYYNSQKRLDWFFGGGKNPVKERGKYET